MAFAIGRTDASQTEAEDRGDEGSQPANALQKPVQPSAALAAVVGPDLAAADRRGQQGLGLHTRAQFAEPGQPPRNPGRVAETPARVRQGQGDHV